MNINLGIAFEIICILYANVPKILYQQCISFSFARTLSFLDKPDNILSQSETQLIQNLLSGNQNYHFSIDSLIINSTIEYLISIERFKRSLFN